MSNLIEQYGRDWFISKFNGSFFLHEGEPHIVAAGLNNNWRTNVPCKKLTKQEERVVVQQVYVPHTMFTDVSVFSIPNLGWRSLDKGRYLSYYKRNNNSYHRGLSMRNLTQEDSQLTRWLAVRSGWEMPNADTMVPYAAMCPEFIPLTEGIEKIRNQEIVSFAASPTIAVFPIGNDQLAVMFKQKQAGVINPDNSMTLHIPELNSYMENM